MPLPRHFWRDVLRGSGIETGRDVVEVDVRAVQDRTSEDRFHLGVSGRVQMDFLRSQVGKGLFMSLWRQIFADVKAQESNRSRSSSSSSSSAITIVDAVVYCASGRHRSVALVDLALHVACSCPMLIFAEHLCRDNWQIQTCNGCAECRRVDNPDKIQARNIAMALFETAKLESGIFEQRRGSK